jgi:sensor histidine kinase YesM
MTDSQTRELLYVVGIGLVVLAVAFGGMRHSSNLDQLRAMMELDSSGHVADIAQLKTQVNDIQDSLEKIKNDELESLRTKLNRIESEEIQKLRMEVDELKQIVKRGDAP